MNRETRRTNLKKLQLPGSSSGGTTRKTRSFEAAKTTKISKYFPTPNSQSNTNEDDCVEKSAVNKCQNQKSDECVEVARTSVKENVTTLLAPEVLSVQNSATETAKLKRSKRTKLTSFVFKNSKDLPEHILAKKETISDDFETPEKKIKRAPKVKAKAKTGIPKPRPKRQPNIKTAFLRNEQIFSEIAAQHCMAENFSPDEMQLALAISKSEAETSGILCLDSDEDEMVVDVLRDPAIQTNKVTSDIRSKLQKYGFRTAARKDYNTIAAAFLPGANRRHKSKWANKFTALTLRDPEVQKKKLNAKIKILLDQQIITCPAPEWPLKGYVLISSTLKKIQSLQEQETVGYAENVSTIDLENYFVKDLFKVSHVKAGHLLKDWTAIQGRDMSPKLKRSQYMTMQKQLNKVYADLEQHFVTPNQLHFEVEQKTEETLPIKIDSIQRNTITRRRKSFVSNIEMEDANKNVLASSINIATIDENNSGHHELDQLLELIEELPENSTKIDSVCNIVAATPISPKKTAKEPPDKKCKLDQEDVTAYELKQSEASSCAIGTCTESDLSTQKIRASSPDIFADTDSEIEEEHKPGIAGKNGSAEENIHGITTYEIYSSDEVKTYSTTEEVNVAIAVIDLTENGNVSLKSDIDYDSQSNETNDNKNAGDFPICDSILKDIGEDTNFKHFEDVDQRNTTAYLQTTPPQKVAVGDDEVFQKLLKKYLFSPRKADESNRKSLSMTQFEKPECSNETTISCTQIKPNRNNLSLDGLVSNIFKTPTKILNKKSPLKRSKSSSFTLIEDDFHSPFKHSEDSIDLTQDDVDDNADEYLMLSDDEINYSIRRADKSMKAGKETSSEVQDITLSSDSESYTDEQKGDMFLNNSSEYTVPSQENNEFTILDLVDGNKTTRPSLTKTASSLNFDGDVEPIFSQFLTTPEKAMECFPPPLTANVSDLSRERAEFGIMDNYSEPYTQALLQKTPPPPSISFDFDASFLSSPSENAVFMKRYNSESTQKFNDLLKTAVQPPTEPADYDEFDRIIYGSPPKRCSLQQNEPKGLEKLLTAELSFRLEDEEHYSSPKKLFITPTKRRNQRTPAKSSPEAGKSKEFPEQHEINGKIYKVRLTTIPKPDFTHQTEAELLKQLYEYGIKPLKRKQAVKILEYIYNQTHPIIVQEEAEEQREHIENATADLNQSNKEIYPAIIDKRESKLNLRDCAGHVLLRFSQELFVEADNEEYVLQTNVSKKISQALLPFHIAWYNLVCSSPALHETILMYEPIDLQEIYLFLKSLGYRYEPKDLKTFFDRRCIIFRYDLTAPGKQAERHIRKNTKKATKKINTKS